MQENREKKYKLRSFRLNLDRKTPDWDTLDKFVPFIRSDHSRFWIINQTDFSSLPAILISDTGEYFYKSCTHIKANFSRNNIFKELNMDFFANIPEIFYIILSASRCTFRKVIKMREKKNNFTHSPLRNSLKSWQ